ncbi:unnamed protein product [Closterium sp. NIES-53]
MPSTMFAPVAGTARSSRESEEAGWLCLVTPSISSPSSSPSPSPHTAAGAAEGGKRGEVEGWLLDGLTPATPVPLPQLPHTLTPSPTAAAAAVGTKGGGGEGKHTTQHSNTRHPHTLPPTAAGRRRRRGWARRKPQSGYIVSAQVDQGRLQGVQARGEAEAPPSAPGAGTWRFRTPSQALGAGPRQLKGTVAHATGRTTSRAPSRAAGRTTGKFKFRAPSCASGRTTSRAPSRATGRTTSKFRAPSRARQAEKGSLAIRGRTGRTAATGPGGARAWGTGAAGNGGVGGAGARDPTEVGADEAGGSGAGGAGAGAGGTRAGGAGAVGAGVGGTGAGGAGRSRWLWW